MRRIETIADESSLFFLSNQTSSSRLPSFPIVKRTHNVILFQIKILSRPLPMAIETSTAYARTRYAQPVFAACVGAQVAQAHKLLSSQHLLGRIKCLFCDAPLTIQFIAPLCHRMRCRCIARTLQGGECKMHSIQVAQRPVVWAVKFTHLMPSTMGTLRRK